MTRKQGNSSSAQLVIMLSLDLTKMLCIGSVAQREELSGIKVEYLHRETVDQIEIPSKKNPGTVLKCIVEVFDCWLELGSKPYAQKHYPFENKESLPKVWIKLMDGSTPRWSCRW
jgi:isoleucyl-tRNA synthetase